MFGNENQILFQFHKMIVAINFNMRSIIIYGYGADNQD